MHRFANPANFLRIAKPLTPILFWPGLILLLGACLWGLFIAPAERLQGDAVKMIFVHVPSAWLGQAAWAGIAIAALVQLVWRHPLAGIAGRAIAVPGALFAGLCLVTGSIWGKSAWGAWWVWDGRLTSMLIMFFLYLGYIALANASDEKGSVSRTTAVFGIIGAVNIPIIKYSVEWWESLHQKASITLGGSSIDGAYLWPLLASVLGFNLLFGAIVLMRMRAALAEVKIDARMRRLAEE